MPKPDGITWREYLSGYGRLRWRSPEDEQEYHNVSGSVQALCDLLYGNLMDQCGAKTVIACRTPKPVQEQGHPPFTFKVQCGTTGRMSRAIPYERLIEFGILTSDTQDGGPFPRERLPVEDRITPLINKLTLVLRALAPNWDVTEGLPWHLRYSEYLTSPEWLSIRQQVLKRDHYRCQWTGKSSRPGDPLQVHHITYDRMGSEDLADLITVCRSAHQNHHRQKAA